MNRTEPDESIPPFADRFDAGRQLAQYLLAYKGEGTIVLALPRGGVPVAFEVAAALHAPLDVFGVRKLGAPLQPELGVGAVAQGEIVLLNPETVHALGISEEQIQAIIARESAELERQLACFRGGRAELNVAGRTVILVDDGLATGLTAAAAIEALRMASPRSIILSAPVAALRTVEWLRTKADDVVVALVPADFLAVGLWYSNFEQTADDEVLDLLRRAQEAPASVQRHTKSG